VKRLRANDSVDSHAKVGHRQAVIPRNPRHFQVPGVSLFMPDLDFYRPSKAGQQKENRSEVLTSSKKRFIIAFSADDEQNAALQSKRRVKTAENVVRSTECSKQLKQRFQLWQQSSLTINSR
jgi:hypothetical protein